MSSNRRWCEALTGLWARRCDPAARVIVHDALEAAESAARMTQGAHWQALLDALQQAQETGQNTEIMTSDRQGRPMILTVYPHEEEQCLNIRCRYARHRLFQMIGEPA